MYESYLFVYLDFGNIKKTGNVLPHFVKNIKSDGKKVVEQLYVQSLNEEPSGNEATLFTRYTNSCLRMNKNHNSL